MTQTLWLIWDTSGSMAENAKRFIARGVAREVEQFCRLGYGDAELKLVAWGNEAQLMEWSPDEEIPPEMLDCNETASVGALLALIGEQQEDKFMLITDGFLARDDAKALKRWKDGLPPDALRMIKVGADSNPQLKGVEVFAAEDVFAALDSWLKGGATW